MANDNDERIRFISPIGQITFPHLIDAEPNNFGGFSWRCTLGWAKTTDVSILIQSMIPLLVKHFGPDWANNRAVKPPLYDLSYTTMKAEEYPFYVDKWLAGFSSTVYPPKDYNIHSTDPVEKEKLKSWLAARRPEVVQFLPGAQTPTPVPHHEIYSGMFGMVSGSCYFSKKKGAVLFSLEHVLKTGDGERVGGGRQSAESAFRGFAPPPGANQNANPFASMANPGLQSLLD